MSTITLEMPNNDAEALLRFLHGVVSENGK